MTTKTLKVSEIECGTETQTRAAIDMECVESYAEAMRDGVTMPPIIVYCSDEGTYWLADGFHRLGAAKAIGAKTIEATVEAGGMRDALRFALAANAEHGLRRTNKDKRRALEIALADLEWGNYSARQLAELCAVSKAFIGIVRKERQPESNAPVKGADGKKYPRGKKGGEKKPVHALEKDDQVVTVTTCQEPARPAEPLVDALGKPVPDKLVSAFESLAEFQRINKALMRLLDDMAALAEGPGGYDLAIHLDGVKREITIGRKNFMATAPHVLWPAKKGDKRPDWVCKSAWKLIDPSKGDTPF